MAKDIYDMTVAELIESGAELHLFYMNEGNYNTAQDIMENFDPIGDIKDVNLNDSYWLSMKNKDESLKIIAFYEDDKDE